jgi:hypothetical protein
MLPGLFNNNVQLFQTRDYVTIYEMSHQARIVPMDGRPHGASGSGWETPGALGKSTLVIDTVNFSDKELQRIEENLHLVERIGPGTIISVRSDPRLDQS